jgi:HTH-type transcriptional repressor of NAD biosynthesis genes
MPPHYGHVFMIETALVHSEEVYLLVYTMETEPLDGNQRFTALRHHFHGTPNLIVKWIEKPMPQEPGDHPDFWEIWKDDISAQVGKKIDCVFGSENYVKTLAENFGCKHFIVDIKRKIVPTSGTACRNQTMVEWESIIPEFRGRMVKKICFVGGESTGKSTMARVMAKVFKTDYVEEYGRKYCETKPPSKFETHDFVAIATVQELNAHLMSKSANRLLFCDTDTIITQAFHKLYLGEFSDELDKIIANSEYFHYFLLAPTIPFEQDGTREFEKERKQQFKLIKQLLEKWKRSYTVIEEPDFVRRVDKIKFLTNILVNKS